MKLVFVTPWYGPNIPGGAEAVARRTVTQLHQAGYPVEVFTTCIRDFHADWGKNYHRPGLTAEEGVPVRRFAVQKRDKAAFDAVNWKLMQGLTVTAAEEQTYIHEIFRCPDLYSYIRDHGQDCYFFFIPYLFATTYFGAQIWPEQTAVIPCLHDESYAYMGIFGDILARVHSLIFLSHAEQTLADQLYPPLSSQVRAVFGGGVDTDWVGDGDRFRQKYGLTGPFILYAGRKDLGKNTPLLLDYWQHYVANTATDLKLVLIGPGEMPIDAPATVDLGFVPLQDKFDAYAAALALCQPSVNESFSLVMMESWLAQTPVLVNGRCAVTVEHCRQAQGGLYFSSAVEFAATLDYLRFHPDIARKMGANGRCYVLANFQWPQIRQRYANLIAKMEQEKHQTTNKSPVSL